MNLPLANTYCVEQDKPCKNDTHSEDNHGIFVVSERDQGIIELDELY